MFQHLIVIIQTYRAVPSLLLLDNNFKNSLRSKLFRASFGQKKRKEGPGGANSRNNSYWKRLFTLFSFIFAGLKFRENFLGRFRESLISRLRRKIVFAGTLISRNRRLSDFIFSFSQKLYVNQQLKQNQYAVP